MKLERSYDLYELIAERDALKKKLVTAVKTLEFYADGYLFDGHKADNDDDCEQVPSKPWYCQSGRRAREALKEILK